MRYGFAHCVLVSPSMMSERRLFTAVEIAASLVLHAVLLAFLLRPVDAPPEAPQERSIAIDIVSAAQFAAALTTPQRPAPAAVTGSKPPAPAPVEPAAAEIADVPGMVHPSRLVAGDVLAEPASRQVRETLPLLASDERMTQLCDIEALEQIHLWKDELHPDTLVAYAMADTVVSGHAVQADGGAFRDARQWYEIKYRCVVAVDFQSLTDFQFSVGDLIPESEWDAHNLTAEEIE
ncbi:MAG TPA: DUF930 domain-containing protein [Devosia sp.]|nr:DUF930 domain-containing protein [Devosia sp.]